MQTSLTAPPGQPEEPAQRSAPHLWPHQLAAREAVRSVIGSGRRSGLVVMPTGTGKTGVFVTVARDLGWPALILVHRDELIQQTVATAERFWPAATVGIIQAELDQWQGNGTAPPGLVVASVQSLHARRLERMPRDRFGLVVADEAHHTAAASWSAILDHFRARFILGVTATPERFDGKGLAERFGEQPIYSYALHQAIKDGRLVEIDQRQVLTELSLDGLTVRDGDFASAELATAINTAARNRIIVEAFREHAADRRAIAFCLDVAHVEALTEEFQAAGIGAVSVTGTMDRDERRAVLRAFAAGSPAVCVSCMVLTEGFDDPGVDCLLMARPTGSRGLYTQMIGRGLRLAPGKTDCRVIDFTDNCRRHKLMTAADLLGRQRPAAAEPRGAEGGGAPEPDLIPGDVVWALESVCPWPELPRLDGYVASARWHHQPATPPQMRFLRTLGVESERSLTRGEASYLIDRALELEAAFPTPATPRQRGFLRHHRQWRDGMSKREASALIGRMRAPV